MLRAWSSRPEAPNSGKLYHLSSSLSLFVLVSPLSTSAMSPVVLSCTAPDLNFNMVNLKDNIAIVLCVVDKIRHNAVITGSIAIY